jgi:hypothetical protein
VRRGRRHERRVEARQRDQPPDTRRGSQHAQRSALKLSAAARRQQRVDPGVVDERHAGEVKGEPGAVLPYDAQQLISQVRAGLDVDLPGDRNRQLSAESRERVVIVAGVSRSIAPMRKAMSSRDSACLETRHRRRLAMVPERPSSGQTGYPVTNIGGRKMTQGTGPGDQQPIGKVLAPRLVTRPVSGQRH